MPKQTQVDASSQDHHPMNLDDILQTLGTLSPAEQMRVRRLAQALMIVLEAMVDVATEQ